MTNAALIDELERFVGVQAKLLEAFWAGAEGTNERRFYRMPRSGSFSVYAELWQWQRHGAGVRFESRQSGSVIDVHKFGELDFCCFDAWRVLQYLESRKISRITVGKEQYDCADELSLKRALEALMRLGVIAACRLDSHHYQLLQKGKKNQPH